MLILKGSPPSSGPSAVRRLECCKAKLELLAKPAEPELRHPLTKGSFWMQCQDWGLGTWVGAWVLVLGQRKMDSSRKKERLYRLVVRCS